MNTPIPNLKNFPVLPSDNQMVDKNGTLTSTWAEYFSQLTTFVQQSINSEGLRVPQQTTSNILILNTTLSKGYITYDSQTDQFKGNVAGTYKTFTLT